MFETAIRQMRMAMAMVWGRPINPRNVERLIADGLKTLDEFGSPGDDVQQLLEGPFSDPAARREFQDRSLQLTARRLQRHSPYYRQIFQQHHVAADALTVDTITAIPVTRKQDLQDHQAAFISDDSHPYLTTRTTGTTGHPAEIWLSRYEIELWPAIAALSGLLRGEIGPRDCMQINISSRATAATQQNMTVCRLVGARTRMLGVIPPAESLESLLTGGADAPTLLSTYPSYLAQLVKLTQERHLSHHDFHLRRVDCGGEPLSAALATAAHDMLGAPINDTFAMTEVLPVSGRVCRQGHVHHDLNMGLIEVLDLATGQPAASGALGSVVITPYYPYRECMPVLRYDTRDVVRRLPDTPLTCELAGIPATSSILGKADHLLHLPDAIVVPRDLVEILEALPSQPWPARFQAEVVGDHIALLVAPEVIAGVSCAEIERRFHQAGIPVVVTVHEYAADAGLVLRPLRADLRETTFAGRRN